MKLVPPSNLLTYKTQERYWYSFITLPKILTVNKTVNSFKAPYTSFYPSYSLLKFNVFIFSQSPAFLKINHNHFLEAFLVIWYFMLIARNDHRLKQDFLANFWNIFLVKVHEIWMHDYWNENTSSDIFLFSASILV